MPNRTGEKAGWTGGWIGALLWILVLALVLFFQGKSVPALLGLALFMGGALSIWVFAPWRHPSTRLWKLMTPLYVVLLLAIAWAVWTYGRRHQPELSLWNALMLLPVFMPMITIGGRSWDHPRPPMDGPKP